MERYEVGSVEYDKGQVLINDDWNTKIGQYTFGTAPQTFYEWAIRVKDKDRSRTLKRYLEFQKDLWLIGEPSWYSPKQSSLLLSDETN